MLNWPSFAAAAVLFACAPTASAQVFSAGLPAGWDCVGNCGTAAADGVVTLAPGGGGRYGFVSTAGGLFGASPFQFGGEADGSRLTSTAFTAAAGDAVDFSFNYVTSDAGNYADYAWARLLRASDDSPVALLFTARTRDSGSVVPGQDMPLPQATLSPSVVTIRGPGPAWSVLAESSDVCWSGLPGCGYTGWVDSTYTLAESGSFKLEFGVVNWNDTGYQSGLAFDGLAVAGVPLVPEPQTWALMLAGLGGVGFVARRRRAG